MNETFNRVVVTGIGIISPVGLDAQTTWQALMDGVSGVDHITAFNAEGFDTTFAAEVKDFDPGNYMDRKDARRTDRFVQFAVAASHHALAQAQLTIDPSNAEEIGVIIGTGMGGIITLSEQLGVLAEKGPGRVSPFTVPMIICDMASGQVSMASGAKGPNYCTISACASGADALGDAFEVVRRGDAKAMIAGGTEAAITPIGVAGFNAARALSTRNQDPQAASRPFDAERDGFVMGEGAAVIILEELEHAKARRAPIIAEMVGYGATADAYHITQPSEGGEGGVRSMRMALKKAGLKPEEIGYINAHGTSTLLNDKLETQAIKTVFGDHARRIPINSSKSMIGHTLGAAGAVESAICLMSIRDGIVHPTINLRNPDPDCDLDYVPGQARRVQIDTALTNSFGFGGHNSTLIFRRYQG